MEEQREKPVVNLGVRVCAIHRRRRSSLRFFGMLIEGKAPSKEAIPGRAFLILVNLLVWWAVEIHWASAYTAHDVVLGLSGMQFFAIMGPLSWGWAAIWLHFVSFNNILNAGGIPSPLLGILPCLAIMVYAFLFSPIAVDLLSIPWWQLHAASASRFALEIPLMIGHRNGVTPPYMMAPFERARAPYKLFGRTFHRGVNIDGAFSLLGLVLALADYALPNAMPVWLVLGYHAMTLVTINIVLVLIMGHMDEPNLLSIRAAGQPDEVASSQGMFSFPFFLLQPFWAPFAIMITTIVFRKAMLQ